jgi:hypothetical protein
MAIFHAVKRIGSIEPSVHRSDALRLLVGALATPFFDNAARIHPNRLNAL